MVEDNNMVLLVYANKDVIYLYIFNILYFYYCYCRHIYTNILYVRIYI